MTYSIQYSVSADNDIYKTVTYITNTLKNPSAAYRLKKAIQLTVNNIILFPYKYPIIKDYLLSSYNIRFLNISNYILFYTVTEETKTIYIVRFLYSRRNWQRILKNYIQYDEYLSQNTGYYIHESQEEYGKQFKKETQIMTKPIDSPNQRDNFDEETARQELYNELKKGLDDIAAGRTYSEEEFFAILQKELED